VSLSERKNDVERTPEQIKNLRKFAILVIGPTAKSMDDNSVVAWADDIQNQVYSIKYIWEIRVRTRDTFETPWEEIKMEPLSQAMTFVDIFGMCRRLVQKFNKPGILEKTLIEEIQITEHEFRKDIYYFRREIMWE